MVTPSCRQCRQVIPSEDVNVANDVAYCRACNLAFPLSALTLGAELDDGVDISKPPAGASRRSGGGGTVVTATHRSLGTAAGLLGIALFWNGIVSVFVLVAIAGTLRNLGVTAPDWFPAPNMNGNPMSVGMCIFLWIFLTPFIVIGLAMAGAFMSCLAGRTEVQIGNAQGVVFTGIGPLGWRRRFEVRGVKEVRVEDQRWRDSDGDRRQKTHIVVELRDGRRIKFGSMLREDRRKFVAAAMRKALTR